METSEMYGQRLRKPKDSELDVNQMSGFGIDKSVVNSSLYPFAMEMVAFPMINHCKLLNLVALIWNELNDLCWICDAAGQKEKKSGFISFQIDSWKETTKKQTFPN